MGQASHNPRSPQYRGPLPEFDLKLGGGIAFAPNEAGKARLADLPEGAEAKLKDSEIDVLVNFAVAFIVPMRLVDKHPAAMIPTGEVRIPLTELKKKAIEVFRAGGHLAAEGLVKFDDADAET